MPPRKGELPPRRWRRRTASLDIVYTSVDGAGVARATTLGAGGLFVRTGAAPPEDSPIRVRFRLPGGAALFEMEARVAWVLAPDEAGPHAPGMGLAFTDSAQVAALAAALESLDRDEAQASDTG